MKVPRTIVQWMVLLLLIAVSIYQIHMQIYWSSASLFGQICDDAYISLVYARNFVAGNGLVYNIGETVEGYTNFLWVMIMSVPFLIGTEPLLFIKVVGALSSILLVGFVYLLSRSYFGLFTSFLISAAVAISAHVAYMSTWGLETIFYVLLYVVAIWLFSINRFVLSGAVFALAAMTRMEVVLIFAVFWIWSLFFAATAEGKKITLKFSSGFIFLFFPYFIWRYGYYGYLLPNTYYAKVAGDGGNLQLLQRGLDYVVHQLNALNILVPTVITFGLGGLLYLFYAVSTRRIHLSEKWVPIVLSGYIYFFYIVWVGGDVFNERFVIHALPLILVGSVIIAYKAVGKFPVNKMFKPNVIGALIAAAFVIGLGIAKPTFPDSTHLTGWVSLGGKLAQEDFHDQSTLATDAAGALKYHSQLPTIDILGLNDIHIAHKKVALGGGTAGHEKQDNTYVLGKQPMYISTWVDPDGGAGRGFKKWFDFRRWYASKYLLDTSSAPISDMRIMNIAANTSMCDIADLARRDKRPVYDWGVWQRLESPSEILELSAGDFSSNFQHILGGCRASYVAKVEDAKLAGTFLFGPYMILPAGTFLTVFVGTISECEVAAQPSVTFDIYNGQRELAHSVISAREGHEPIAFRAELAFENSPVAESRFEFRAFSHGNCKIEISRVNISKML